LIANQTETRIKRRLALNLLKNSAGQNFQNQNAVGAKFAQNFRGWQKNLRFVHFGIDFNKKILDYKTDKNFQVTNFNFVKLENSRSIKRINKSHEKIFDNTKICAKTIQTGAR
jgi:hypothetical protein